MSLKTKFIRVLYGTEIRRRPILYGCLFYVLIMILLIARIFYGGGGHSQVAINNVDKSQSKFMTKKFIWTGQPSSSSCKKSQVGNNKSMAILVTSARSNFKERILIRETWGNVLTYQGWTISSIVFMLGAQGDHEEDETEQGISKDLELEHHLHGDLVTQNFVDSYKNLVLKSSMGIQWLLTFCPDVQMVVKVDDDVVINVFELIKNLNQNPAILSTSSFFCYLLTGEKPHRNETSKWYVSGQEYPEADYPPFCSGTAWLAPVTVIKKMATILDKFDHKMLWLEDVFMTGIVPAKFNAKVDAADRLGFLMTGSNLRGDTEKIGHVCKAKEWYFCPACQDATTKELFEWFDWFEHSEDGGGRKGGKKSRIQKKFESKIFFVMEHGPNFSNHFLKTWNTIQKVNHDNMRL